MKNITIETMIETLREMGFEYEIKYDTRYNANYLNVLLPNDKIPLKYGYNAGNTYTIENKLNTIEIITIIRNYIVQKEQGYEINRLRMKSIEKDGMCGLTDRELDQLENFITRGYVSKEDLETVKCKRNELFANLTYLTNQQKEAISYIIKKKEIKKWNL